MVRALVDGILSYLSVNERTRDSIYKSLVPALERGNTRNPENVYRRVTEWIDRSGRYYYTEKSHVRLDEARSPGDNKTNLTRYQDKSAEDPLDLLLHHESEQQSITPDELKGFFSSKLPPQQYRLLDYLLNAAKNGANEKYDGRILEKYSQIEKRLEALADRFYGTLLIPKRLTSVNFDAGVNIKYRRGYADDIVMKVYLMLLDGLSIGNISGLTGISVSTVDRWKKSVGLPSMTRISDACLRITKFTENKLKEAAEKGMTLEQAALYAATATVTAKGVWRKLGYDWISSEPEKEREILGYIDEGKRKYEVRTLAGISEGDMDYFLATRQNRTKKFLHSGRQRSLEIKFPEKHGKIFHSYEMGMGYREIAEYAGVNKVTVWRKLKKVGIKRARPLGPAQKSVIKAVKSADQPVTSGEVHKALNSQVCLEATIHALERANKKELIERIKIGNRWFYFCDLKTTI